MIAVDFLLLLKKDNFICFHNVTKKMDVVSALTSVKLRNDFAALFVFHFSDLDC